MASGLGAGITVMSLPLADLGDGGWRFVYIIALIWLTAAVAATRRLTETPRFEHIVETHHVGDTHIDKRRFAIIAGVAFLANLFISTASYFQNRYLDDVRGYSTAAISIFHAHHRDAGVDRVRAGRSSGRHGRAPTGARGVDPVGDDGPGAVVHVRRRGDVWMAAFVGGLLAGIAYPAFSVYRAMYQPVGAGRPVG